jgi:cytidylate kinase
MDKRSIAIDGPSGAGKSTLARLLSEHFGLKYVDTGALYRCLGLHALRNGADPKDEEAVAALLSDISVDIRYDRDGIQRLFLNGEDVSDDIRMPEVSLYASDVSAHARVRAFLLGMQRELADKYNVIMDGRDIGTVVLPNAGIKIFLTADVDDRARRRYKELAEKGVDVRYDDVLADMVRRDENDVCRKNAPLKAADDAIIVNTTGFELYESFEKLKTVIEENLKK